MWRETTKNQRLFNMYQMPYCVTSNCKGYHISPPHQLYKMYSVAIPIWELGKPKHKYIKYRPLICFLPLEFSQNWRKMASYMLRGDQENKGRRNKAATGSFITGYSATPQEKHRAVRAPGWLIHPVGRKGKEEKGHVSRLALKEWEGFP